VPRKLRIVYANGIYHVVNRGNDKRVIFPQAADYDRFIDLMRQGRTRTPIALVGFCLMPTHFHLVIQPPSADALSTYMQWITCSYACDFRLRTGTRGFGHVFQRRFWAAPIEDEVTFIRVLRYVEGNAHRAHLVPRAQDWRWTSLGDRLQESPQIIDPCPLTLPAPWCDWVNLGQEEAVLDAVRRALKKMP
jgi:putative transposase